MTRSSLQLLLMKLRFHVDCVLISLSLASMMAISFIVLHVVGGPFSMTMAVIAVGSLSLATLYSYYLYRKNVREFDELLHNIDTALNKIGDKYQEDES